mmetsp:Transcript_1701/g.3513  ORF Transcript_1701/g.3513 Transcript_1701/m.3513 type:complete len:110 (-) Transcript_1701:418-747(-)
MQTEREGHDHRLEMNTDTQTGGETDRSIEHIYKSTFRYLRPPSESLSDVSSSFCPPLILANRNRLLLCGHTHTHTDAGTQTYIECGRVRGRHSRSKRGKKRERAQRGML